MERNEQLEEILDDIRMGTPVSPMDAIVAIQYQEARKAATANRFPLALYAALVGLFGLPLLGLGIYIARGVFNF